MGPLLVKTEAKNLLSISAFSMLVVARSSVLLIGAGQGYSIYYHPLMSYVLEETLLIIFYIFSQVQLHLCFGFPGPLPSLLGHIPLISPEHFSLSPLPIHFGFVF